MAWVTIDTVVLPVACGSKLADQFRVADSSTTGHILSVKNPAGRSSWSFGSLAAEMAGLAIVLAAHLVALWRGHWFVFALGDEVRWIPLALATAPVLAAYLAVRLVARPLTSAMAVASVLVVMSIAHRVRLSATGEPLVWRDLTALENLSVIGAYFKPLYVLLLTGIAFAWIVVWRVGRTWLPNGLPVGARVAALLICLPAAIWPFLEARNLAGTEHVRGWLEARGAMFRPWDLAGNVARSGLPLHLLQTSVVSSPTGSTREEQLEFERLVDVPVPDRVTPKRIVLIVCESCWHDDAHFRDLFAGVRAEGFREFRAVSPVYGGLTVNASFELLTGLPSRGPLRGVIYREHGDRLAKRVHALPTYLAAAGYVTTELHNNTRTFWSRDRVFSNMGFDAFLGIEDMDRLPSPGPWARDRVLFDAASKSLLDRPDSRHFMKLTTVYTHGTYRPQGDTGEADYTNRLRESLADVVAFVRQVRQSEPDTLILMVADHKPALNRYFLEHGVLQRADFAHVGPKESDMVVRRDVAFERIGDVPAYVLHPDAELVEAFLQAANGKPFFCVATALDEVFLGGRMPSTRFARRAGSCERALRSGYAETVRQYPEWLFASSLFGDEKGVKH